MYQFKGFMFEVVTGQVPHGEVRAFLKKLDYKIYWFCKMAGAIPTNVKGQKSDKTFKLRMGLWTGEGGGDGDCKIVNILQDF